MRYRLIYYCNGEQGSYWSTSYSWILERYILCQKCGYDVEIWEYNDQGSHLLERGLYNERNRYLLTVHWDYIPKKTYVFVHLLYALETAKMVKISHPDIRINLIRKELTPEQCEAVLSTGNLPT